MASAHYTLSSVLAPQATGRTTLRIPISSKRHRKNHLRPKILKILTKPYPLALPLLPSPPPPPHPILPQENNNLCVELPAEETLAGEPDKLEELQVSEGTTKDNGVFQNVSAVDILKYGGMYFLGFFVLQTIYTVWIVGIFKFNQKDRDLEIDRDEKTVSWPVHGASNVFLSEEQVLMDKKIEEIKLMAREARRIESEKKGKEDEDEDFEVDDDDDDEGAVSSNRLGIEKEIGERLLKVQNRINGSAKDISAALQINSRGNSAAGVDRGVNKNVKNKGNEALVFKKKFKFKSPSTKDTKTPKGFPGNRDWKESKATKRGSESKKAAQDHGSDDVSDHAQMLHEDKRANQPELVTQKSVSSVPSEEGGKVVDDKSKVMQDSINGNSRHELAKKNSQANRVKVKQANTKTDVWWLNLHYVFVILMQRDSEEGLEGLYYGLKFTSKEQEQSDDDSYTVAFEDHADANNFCFLLKSFFEDLGSFSAYAVPMPIQELNEEIISRAKKVVVVKKRQLQLYAGQPLADVEMHLRSIIEQDQIAP
ncbi:hypothetical protein glysoja_004383 [Glycine soja]|nr:hypothetical protein glysoja_004383 [Glycine soja]